MKLYERGTNAGPPRSKWFWTIWGFFMGAGAGLLALEGALGWV